jgi:AraC-like DNA-binding protein
MQLDWIKYFIKIFFSAFIILFIVRLVDYKNLIDFSEEIYQGYLFDYRDYIIMVISFTILWLSVGGFKQSQIVRSNNEYLNSLEDGKDYSIISNALLKFMDEKKLYLDPQLNLNMLSAESNISSREISLALNHHLKKKFYWFVNEYRVEEAKKRLGDAGNDHLKILTIAFDCGFNSKATFNRIFKKITGKNPGYFRNHT